VYSPFIRLYSLEQEEPSGFYGLQYRQAQLLEADFRTPLPMKLTIHKSGQDRELAIADVRVGAT
jgi:hypothetical protein